VENDKGQEIVDAAITAGTQSAPSRNQLTELVGEVIPLCLKPAPESNSKNLWKLSGCSRDQGNVPHR